MFFGPHLLEADDGRCRQTWRVADEGRQHFLEVAGRDSLQVEDGDQHLKTLRSPRVSRQDRWRVSDALAFARCTVAHPRLANGDRADAGHDVALWKMAMTHHALMARLGLEIRMLCEKLSNLRLDRLSQQRTRAAAQDLCQGVGEDPWLGELDDVIVGHGVSLLHWRSGGVEHHHDTPPYPVSPSPTSGHSSRRRIEIDSNTVERAMRPIALSRKNALFVGSDEGAENWAMLASLIESCKLHGVNPEAYLADVLTKLVNNWPNSRLAELTPWGWAAAL